MPTKKPSLKSANKAPVSSNQDIDAVLQQLEKSLTGLMSEHTKTMQALTHHIDVRCNAIEDHLSNHALRIDQLENNLVTINKKFNELASGY